MSGIRSFIVAAAASLAFLGSASAQISPGTPQWTQARTGFTLADMRSIVSTAPFTLLQETTLSSGTPVFIVEVARVRVGILMSCRNANACVGAQLNVLWPTTLSSDAVNAFNLGSKFGWLASTSNGNVLYTNGLLFAGVSAEGVSLSTQVFAAVFIERAGGLVQTSAPATGPYSGRDIVDTEHQPQMRLSSSEAVAELLATIDFATPVEEIVADTQTYAKHRKIANEFLGQN